eukprot:scaffold14044_cov52-Phaeocystis_antarctica.AAC.7
MAGDVEPMVLCPLLPSLSLDTCSSPRAEQEWRRRGRRSMRSATAVVLASVAGGCCFSPLGGGCGSANVPMRRDAVSMKQDPPRPTFEDVIWGAALDWFKNSEMAAKKHQEHVNGDGVVHMMKGTPFVNAPDALKLRFVNDGAGRLVSEFMRREQRELGQWKVEKIIEAAGPEFDRRTALQELKELARSAPVVVLSFVDCPWCLAAKTLLLDELAIPPEAVRVVELEELGRDGKSLRAAAALATGRTSMPNVFVGGRSVGGYTDGFTKGERLGEPGLCLPDAPGLQPLYASGKLEGMLRKAEQKQQMLETHLF